MSVRRKGLGLQGTIATVVVAAVIIGVFSYYTVGPGSAGFPSTPEEYSAAWQTYAAVAFGENQPWAILSMFFFPLLIYFSAFYFSLSLGLLSIASRARINYNEAQKPLTIFCLAISFIMLPGPFTNALYNISPILGMSPIIMMAALLIGSLILLIGGGKVISDLFPRQPGAAIPEGPPAQAPLAAEAGEVEVDEQVIDALDDALAELQALD